MKFSVAPTTVRVLSNQSFYVEVRGSGVGFIRCAGVHRWVWGAFTETFLVQVGPDSGLHEIVVFGVGLAGRHSEAVKLELLARVASVRVAPRVTRPHIPGLPKLRVPSVRWLHRRVAAELRTFRERP